MTIVLLLHVYHLQCIETLKFSVACCLPYQLRTTYKQANFQREHKIQRAELERLYCIRQNENVSNCPITIDFDFPARLTMIFYFITPYALSMLKCILTFCSRVQRGTTWSICRICRIHIIQVSLTQKVGMLVLQLWVVW